jgi:Cu/Ag efflux pump CusA
LSFALLQLVAICVIVIELVVWFYMRARRLREGRGDIRAIPFALFGGYGLPWPYAAVAFAVGTAALVAFIHG